MKKVAFLDTVHPVLEEGLEEIGWKCVDFSQTNLQEIKELISDFNGIVIRSRFPMNEEFLREAKSLEFIARSGAGMENIDEDYCAKNSIQLFNAPEGNRNAVAEHALGMLLNLFNKLNKCDREVREGKWLREDNRGIELEGKTVAIIGYGNNGSALAKILRGFGIKLLVYDKYKSNFGNDFVNETSMDEIFKSADVVSLHIPQNDETKRLVCEDWINRFKKPFYLINLSRGKIVDTESLVTALNNGKIKGACLDVLEYEKSSFEDMFNPSYEIPTAFRQLLQSDKVILSPHVGGWTHESYFKLSKVLLEKIKEFYYTGN